MTFKSKKHITNLLFVLGFGITFALICQFFTPQPKSREIHIKSFRYGKDPSVIRCNRGDTLKLTFSTEDTGHSFFLEEFDIDAKVSPARDLVEVFKTSDPTELPELKKEVVLIAKHPGVLNYLVSKSNYRCHVWCGPMHAFEHGKLIIMPNTLLFFSLGAITGILLLWFWGFYFQSGIEETNFSGNKNYRDISGKSGFIRAAFTSRWPQTILIFITMTLMYVVVLTSLFGTKMSGRNLGVLLMWGVWLFILIAILTPFLGRIWCTVCPLPFFGDWLQRRSIFSPIDGKTGTYRNKFFGLFLRWPEKLQNNWPKLILLLALTTFSTTLVALPKVTGYAVLMLVLLPTVLSVIFEHRAFCRYLCPVSGFVGPFSRMSTLALRKKSEETCQKCKANFCEKGSNKGWACPYGLNMGEIDENSDCGLCLECTRSCLYNNVSLYARPFGAETGTRNISEAWLTIGVFTLAIVYSILYQGHWPVVRDYINILDKGNWSLFGIYTSIVWISALAIMPGVLFLLSQAGVKLSGIEAKTKQIFLANAGTLLPLGLSLWISFVLPMLFVNVTFVLQSLSDPFGWGWDFFGTASIPWHQFLPRLVPWLQAFLILTGFFFSLKNLKKGSKKRISDSKQHLFLILPMALFLFGCTVTMIIFFVN